MLKRLATTSVGISLVVLVLGAASAVAGGGGASVSVVPVSFATLSSASCPYVPAGLVINWSGPERQIATVRTDASGVTTVSVTSHASGKATDQNSNPYAFDYSNQFRVSNTVENQNLFTGVMTDHFSLAGNGVHLSNGFMATFKTNLVDQFYEFQPINVRGDPISFSDGQAHCDPL
jgi:hypothetical protein